MNWFEPIFLDLAPHAGLIAECWRAAAILLLGAVATAVLLRGGRLRHRLIGALAIFTTWEALMPDRPLSFLPGRVAALQDEVLLILALALIGILGVLRSLRRPRLQALPLSIAALMIASLGYTYHLVLINGLDAQLRAERATQLSHLLDLSDPAWVEVCALPGHRCGDELPRSPQTAFEHELNDWMTHALPNGRNGRVASSDGTLGAQPPNVWAAERQDGQVRWIRLDRTPETRAVELAFFSFSLFAVIFWFAAALGVEHLHRNPRVSRRR